MITHAEEKKIVSFLTERRCGSRTEPLPMLPSSGQKWNGVIHGFLVEKGTKGFTAPEMTGKLSLRASVTSELIFQDCIIPKENKFPKTDGLKSPLMCLNQAALRNCLGRYRFGDGMLRCRAQLRKIADTIRQTDCIIPVDAGKISLHADRNYKGTASLSPSSVV